MEVSIFLAKVMGLYLIIATLALGLGRKPAKKLKEFAKDVPVILFGGILALLLGLLVVVSHNIWTRDWRVVITIMGWLMLIKGVFRLMMPEKVLKWSLKIISTVTPFAFVLMLLIGIYLTYVGFTA